MRPAGSQAYHGRPRRPDDVGFDEALQKVGPVPAQRPGEATIPITQDGTEATPNSQKPPQRGLELLESLARERVHALTGGSALVALAQDLPQLP
ncbi:MAG TPA: hypothetical protein VFM88_03845 [Vicinamibacteria bacterium]|nr:hypothetical protein [Vicinamibacteria bacterium]